MPDNLTVYLTVYLTKNLTVYHTISADILRYFTFRSVAVLK